MSTLQVRDVPDELRRVMKEHAARAGMSLSDYVRGELERLAAQPSVEEVLTRARARGEGASVSSLDAVKAARADR